MVTNNDNSSPKYTVSESLQDIEDTQELESFRQELFLLFKEKGLSDETLAPLVKEYQNDFDRMDEIAKAVRDYQDDYRRRNPDLAAEKDAIAAGKKAQLAKTIQSQEERANDLELNIEQLEAQLAGYEKRYSQGEDRALRYISNVNNTISKLRVEVKMLRNIPLGGDAPLTSNLPHSTPNPTEVKELGAVTLPSSSSTSSLENGSDESQNAEIYQKFKAELDKLPDLKDKATWIRGMMIKYPNPSPERDALKQVAIDMAQASLARPNSEWSELKKRLESLESEKKTWEKRLQLYMSGPYIKSHPNWPDVVHNATINVFRIEEDIVDILSRTNSVVAPNPCSSASELSTATALSQQGEKGQAPAPGF